MRTLQAVGLVCAVVAALWGPPVIHAQTADESLEQTQPGAPRVVALMNEARKRFANYIFWDDHPRDVGALIHQPDTTGWNAPTSSTPQAALTSPSTDGAYQGTIDRTVSFLALTNGMVGQPGRAEIRYSIIGEEQYFNIIDIAAPYTPGEPIDLIFQNSLGSDTLDLGVTLSFSTGVVDSNGVFTVCIEDFEGFHIWRGIEPDGSDLTVLGELSKEEENMGSLIDSIYFNAMLPALRTDGFYELPADVPGMPNPVDIREIHPNGRLGPEEHMWFDYNAFNGFTYYYTVTTFDRTYDCRSGRQGLEKIESCPVTQGLPFPCPEAITSTSTKNTPQSDLQRVYAVPNPYRTGTTRFTTPNYHNFPDEKMRFVNVPSQCYLKIYTTAGDLVANLLNDGPDGVIEWDVTNDAGEDVSSGIYIYRLETFAGDSVFGRIVIIR